MAQLPIIYTIQASGARQHGGKLEAILQTLKEEHRITDYATLGPDVSLAKLKEQLKANDMVLLLLTQELEPQKELLENKLDDLTTAQPDIKVAEIIVDKVVYDNKFITFPADLRPIRDREDMDAVWDSIEQSLKDMFPAEKKEEPVAPTPTDWSKYLKIAGVIIGLLVAFFVVRAFMGEDDGKNDEDAEVVAGFTANPTACEAPCEVQFENTSENSNVYRWDFGDGATSSETTPSHTFNAPGEYTITLTASRGEQSAEQAQAIEVNPPENTSGKVTVVSLSPSSPAELTVGQNVNFTFHYETDSPDGVRIFGRPFTGGNQAPNYAAHGSQILPTGKGNAKGYFTIKSPATVNKIRFQMLDPGQDNLLYEIFVPVNYKFVAEEDTDNGGNGPSTSLSNEDCLPFNFKNLQVRADDSRFLITDGNSRMMLFRTKAMANMAVRIIQNYQFETRCFAVRPDPELSYFKVNGDIPSGNFPGEDCIRINNPQNLTIRQSSNTLFQILDGNHIPFAAKSRKEAERIVEVVKHYKARFTCYVERPNPGMVYLRK